MGEEKKVSRRAALKAGIAGIAGLAVGAVGGYFGRPPEVREEVRTVTETRTVTQEVRVGPELPDEIVLGGVGPLSPPGTVLGGEEIRNGMQLLIDQINEAGGVLGRPVRLIFEDTRGIPDEGVAAFTRLVTEKGAVLVMGEYHSSVAAAMVDVANRLEVPLITTETCADIITAKRSPWTFRVGGMPVSFEFNFVAEFMGNAGYKNAGAIVENTDYGRDGDNFFRQKFPEVGIKYTSIEVDIAATDMTAQLLQLKEAGIDALLNVHTNYGLLFTQAIELGMTMENGVDWMDPTGAAQFPDIWDIAGERAVNVPFISFYHRKANSTLGNFFDQWYREKYGRGPTWAAYEAYDTALVAIDAIMRAGSVDSEALRQSLLKTKILGTRVGLPPSLLIEFTTRDEPRWWHQQWAFAPTFVNVYTEVGQESADSAILWPLDWADVGWRRHQGFVEK